jgi:UDP-N-acetylmuramoylalanine--D-glutamate ligase
MDRYKNFEHYIESKKNIFKNQTDSDYAVLNFNDNNIKKIIDNISPEKIYFNNKEFYNLQNDFICYRNNKILNVNELKIFGNHNYENVMAVLAIADILKLNLDKTKEIIKQFKGVEHRIEFVRKINNIEIYNDSKATNVESVLKCLQAFTENNNLILILGGRDKNDDFTRLVPELQNKVKKIVVTGEACEKIKKQLNLCSKVVVEPDFDKAVYTAYEQCSENDKLVLSPGCASFDRFQNYEHRGKYFKQLVKKIK